MNKHFVLSATVMPICRQPAYLFIYLFLIIVLDNQDFFEGLSSRTYKYVVVKYNTAYLLKMNSPNTYSETDIIRMVELFIDNIYVEFCGPCI